MLPLRRLWNISDAWHHHVLQHLSTRAAEVELANWTRAGGHGEKSSQPQPEVSPCHGDYIRWVHIPKTGTSFVNVLIHYANASLPPNARMSTCDAHGLHHDPNSNRGSQQFTRNHISTASRPQSPYEPHICSPPYDGLFTRFPMSTWFRRCFAIEPPLEHATLSASEWHQHRGHLYALFRDPLKLYPSQYFRAARPPGRLQPPYDDVDFATPRGQRALLAFVQKEEGAQCRFITQMEASPELAREAIRRLEGFRLVGITDEWETTVYLFNRMVMRDRPCLPVEFENNRATQVVPGTTVGNMHLGTEALQRANFTDRYDALLWEAVRRRFHRDVTQYGVTLEACTWLKCTKLSWSAAELELKDG